MRVEDSNVDLFQPPSLERLREVEGFGLQCEFGFGRIFFSKASVGWFASLAPQVSERTHVPPCRTPRSTVPKPFQTVRLLRSKEGPPRGFGT